MTSLKKALVPFGFALVLLSVGSAVSFAAKPDVAAVHAADKAWLKAYNGNQVDAVVALYDANATVYPPGAAPAHGTAEIHAFFEKDMAGLAQAGLALSLGENPDGAVAGDWGWASGTWSAKDKSGQVVDTGWYFSVSHKVAGKWLYVRDTWNSNKPAAPAAAEVK